MKTRSGLTDAGAVPATATAARPVAPIVDGGARVFWEKGNLAKLVRGLDEAAQALVAAAGVATGDHVLDVAAGDGNAALWAARAGASVTAVDLSPRMVAAGRARSAGAGFQMTWAEADMHALPFRSGRFDYVVSSLGVMCSENPTLAAAELFRVIRTGGTVATVSWSPQGWPGQLRDVVRHYLPARPGSRDHLEWGREAGVRELLSPHAVDVRLYAGVLWNRYRSLEAWWEQFSETMPLMQTVQGVLDAHEYQRLEHDLLAWLREASVPCDRGAQFPSPYLIAVAHKQ